MSYINDFYINPFLKAAARWRDLLYTFIIEILFFSAVYSFWSLANSVLNRFSMIISGIELEYSDKFLNTLPSYSADLGTFLMALYLIASAFLLASFILYTISRTVIWQRILAVQMSFIRNALVDLTFFAVLLLLTLFFLMYIKTEVYLLFLILFIFPVLYYSFFCHMNLSKKGYQKPFASALSGKLFYPLPHLLVMIAVLVMIPKNVFSAIFLLAVFCFYRVYALEIISANK
jgi:hypothetical protein